MHRVCARCCRLVLLVSLLLGLASSAAAQRNWYFAEGATGYFQEYVLILNPGTTATAQVTLSLTNPVQPEPGRR